MHKWEQTAATIEAPIQRRAIRPSRKRTYAGYAWHSVMLLSPAAMFLAWSAYLHKYSEYYALAVFPGFMSLPFFVGFGVLMIWMIESLKMPTIDTVPATEPPEPEPEPTVSRPFELHETGMNNQHTIKLGKYDFGTKSRDFAQAIANHPHHTMIRDHIPSGLDMNASKNWDKIVADFFRMGVIDKNNNLTPAYKKKFYDEFGIWYG